MILLALLIAVPNAAGQETGPSTKSEPAASSERDAPTTADERPNVSSNSQPSIPAASGRIQYVGPDTYILLDAQGRPQPMPGMTYEDFMAAWKRLQQADKPNRQPRYVIDDIELDGRVRSGYAELNLDATLRVLTDEPVEVPLGLIGAILQGQPRFERVSASSAQPATPAGARSGDADDAYLDFDAQRGGFVARFSGGTKQSHKMSMTLLVPLSRDGSETILAMTCPRSVSSQLTLQLDTTISDASITSGTLIAKEPNGGGTRLVAAGLTGPFRLAWQNSESRASELTTVLNAEGAIRVAIDGRSVQSDARITVRSYGGSFDRFRVRLPRGAQLIEHRPVDSKAPSPAYRVSLQAATSHENATADAQEAQIVLVELPEKQQGPVVVDLSTEQPIGLDNADLAVQLAGFEVLGAVRQFGDVALQVADDWQARWEIGRFVRQVDPDELDAQLQKPGLTAAFQYDRQPWSLEVAVGTRNLRVHVTPKYELNCSADEARLGVHLTYQVLGARAFQFLVKLNDWELTPEPIESGGLVDQDRVHVTPDGTLELPLAQAASRRAEISFIVKRAMPRDARTTQLPLPVPLADSVSSGELSVEAAADIELLPDVAKSKGLAPTPLVEPLDTAADDNDGTEFRYRTMLPEAVFVTDRIRRTREVTSDVATRIVVDVSGARIDERIDYVVRYEPLKELLFEVPEKLGLDASQSDFVIIPASGRGESGHDRQQLPLNLATLFEEGDVTDMGQTRLVRVPLPQPRLGRFAVRISYRVAFPADELPSRARQIPLFTPVDGETIAERAAVESARGISVALDSEVGDSSWKSADTTDLSVTGSQIDFTSGRAESSLPLVISAKPLDQASTVVVDRVWLQTWLAGATRQDRAAFRFRTSGSQVTVELAPQAPTAEIEVLVDGRTADAISRDGGRIVVALELAANDLLAGANREPALRTLELRYRQPTSGALVASRRLTPPQIVGTTALSETYWQIVLPGDSHVLRSPPEMTTASEWQWLGSFLGRRPIKSQSELEEWVGASHQLAPSDAQNEYLYTGLAPVSSIELVTAPRWLIVLAASGCVLAFVLAWIYLPALRRGWILIALACVLIALAVAFPTPALVLAQASVLGVALAALALLIWRLVARPMRWSVVVPGGSSLRQATPRPESIVMPPIAATASTSPTISLQVPDSER